MLAGVAPTAASSLARSKAFDKWLDGTDIRLDPDTDKYEEFTGGVWRLPIRLLEIGSENTHLTPSFREAIQEIAIEIGATGLQNTAYNRHLIEYLPVIQSAWERMKELKEFPDYSPKEADWRRPIDNLIQNVMAHGPHSYLLCVFHIHQHLPAMSFDECLTNII
ncbi:hypothetical protein BS47DRAFT_1342233 [Hydnum rufescens UP504]|uniref:Uncharacterized protein n=1 Tax=Hydnum rufescens UP504 TaxID=1448309 RepID=A0A9P6DU87_9AGAM|nr:hypothetical protein BS47DRAFT_1342233 [Hydnum rufescens UP504]